MESKPKITSLLITYNEENNIKSLIESLDFVDEFIIIDSFSTDNTVAIINEYPNIKLIQREFDDFSSQKNFAIEQATNNWIVFFDADDRISDALKEEILATVHSATDKVAYWIKRTNIYMNRRIKYSGWQKDKVIRLFKKDQCRYNGKLVHEEIVADGEVGYLNNTLTHCSYKGLDKIILKRNKYAALQAMELYEKGVKPNLYHFLVKPAFRFFNHYILKRGFLDGYQGLFISFIYGYSVFIRYVKLWLLHHKLD